MHKKIMTFLLISGFFSTIQANNNDSGQLAVALAQTAVQAYGAADQHSKCVPSQRNFLRQIYWLDKENPHFYKLHAYQENFDYYIAALTDHIAVLKEKKAAGKSGLTSWGMAKGVGLSGLTTLCSYATHILWQARNEIDINEITDRQGYMNIVVVMGFVSVLCTVAAVKQFHKVSRYAKRIVERLERDERLLANFQNEKPNLSKNHIVSAALKLIEVVAEAINTNAPIQSEATEAVVVESIVVSA